jgi:hypothetical protein
VIITRLLSSAAPINVARLTHGDTVPPRYPIASSPEAIPGAGLHRETSCPAHESLIGFN